MKKIDLNSTDGEKQVPSPSEALDLISTAFAMSVGGGRAKVSVHDLAAGLGKTDSAVYQYRTGEKSPSAVELIRAMVFLGPDFINKIFLPLGMVAEDVSDTGADVLAVMATASGVLDGFTKAIVGDLNVDHVEAADLLPLVRSLSGALSKIEPMLSDAARNGGSLKVVGGK